MSPRMFLALQRSRLRAFLMSLSPSRLWQPRVQGLGRRGIHVTVLEKAAILLERLARNHPLPDGNKRTAFFLAGLFLEANGMPLREALPDVDVPMVELIAGGQAAPDAILSWLSQLEQLLAGLRYEMRSGCL